MARIAGRRAENAATDQHLPLNQMAEATLWVLLDAHASLAIHGLTRPAGS